MNKLHAALTKSFVSLQLGALYSLQCVLNAPVGRGGGVFGEGRGGD